MGTYGGKTYEMYKQVILELIPKGKDNRKPMQHFRDHTGLPRRLITDILKDLREEYPICTTRQSPGGYWIATTSEELEETILMLQNTLMTVNQSIRYLLDHKINLELGEQNED